MVRIGLGNHGFQIINPNSNTGAGGQHLSRAKRDVATRAFNPLDHFRCLPPGGPVEIIVIKDGISL